MTIWRADNSTDNGGNTGWSFNYSFTSSILVGSTATATKSRGYTKNSLVGIGATVSATLVASAFGLKVLRLSRAIYSLVFK